MAKAKKRKMELLGINTAFRPLIPHKDRCPYMKIFVGKKK